MNRVKTPAVVLRRWPYSESSLVLRALTPERGVVSLFAKGCERPKSGSMGVLDTWCLVEIEYRALEDVELCNLYESRLLHRFPRLAASADRLAVAGIVAEIAEHAAPPGPSASQASCSGSNLWMRCAASRLSQRHAHHWPSFHHSLLSGFSDVSSLLLILGNWKSR